MRFAALLTLLSIALFAADWTGFRGPKGNGVAEGPNLPTTWDSSKNVSWKVEIPGKGHSQPVVSGNRVFITADIEGDPAPDIKEPKHFMDGADFHHVRALPPDHRHSLQLLCLDAGTGRVLWQRVAYEGTVFDSRDKKSNYATLTPVTDGERVIVSFESQGVYAYNFQGDQLWKASFGGIKTAGIGAGTSPVLAGDNVIFQFDQDDGRDSFIAALNKKDGKVAWRMPRSSQVSWSTPVLAGGQLIVSSTESTIAYDPKTGKELWKGPGVEGNAVPSPVSGNGMAFVSSGVPKKRLYALQLDGSGDHVAWTYQKGTAYVISPILYGDYLYILTDAGLMTCLDAKTGTVKYEGKRPPKPANFSASPIAFNGKILLTSEEGETYVIAAGPEHSIVATNPIGEGVIASLAVAGDSIYIRAEKHLFRIRNTDPARP
jgi:outer membrane protein assembly factor BamB